MTTIELNQNEKKAFADLNTLRESPSKFEDNFNLVAKAYSRIPLKKGMSNDLIEFTKKLKTLKGKSAISMSNGLTQVAKQLLDIIVNKGEVKVTSMDIEDLNLLLRKHVGGFSKIIRIIDRGSVDNLYARCVVHDEDPKRVYRDAIFDEEILFCGLAIKENENIEETVTVIILADNITEGESKHEFNPKDYPELKEAFDLFDVSKIGRISCDEIKKTMSDLGFIYKCPVVYDIIDKLDTPELLIGADFNDFMGMILSRINNKSKDGLKQIFDLYKDDINSEVISLRGLKRMAYDLDEKDLLAEIHGLINMANTDAITLSYDEFIQYYCQDDEVAQA